MFAATINQYLIFTGIESRTLGTLKNLRRLRFQHSILLTMGALLVLCSSYSYSSGIELTYPEPENHLTARDSYFRGLLHLSMSKAGFSDISILPAEEKMEQGRAVKQLARDQVINVIWTMTSIERESRLLPIRIPLLKGLLGYRIFIIRTEDVHKFEKINVIEQLKEYVAGQGHDWPDTQILRSNGLTVHTSSNYEGLFSMLKLGRFDYFPRGINEIWQEMEAHKGQGLSIESNLMLYYPSPIYFFVNQNNERLASFIRLGLEKAIEDGSFDQYFMGFEGHKAMFEQANLGQRSVISLENPGLPEKTPLTEKAFWLVPGTRASK